MNPLPQFSSRPHASPHGREASTPAQKLHEALRTATHSEAHYALLSPLEVSWQHVALANALSGLALRVLPWAHGAAQPTAAEVVDALAAIERHLTDATLDPESILPLQSARELARALLAGLG